MILIKRACIDSSFNQDSFRFIDDEISGCCSLRILRSCEQNLFSTKKMLSRCKAEQRLRRQASPVKYYGGYKKFAPTEGMFLRIIALITQKRSFCGVGNVVSRKKR